MPTAGERRALPASTGEPTGSPTGEPTRTCVGCRVSCAQGRLLRLRLAGSRVVPALERRAAAGPSGGRSAYLCPRRDCLDRAIKRRAFTRAFSSRQTARSVEVLDATAAERLWTTAIEQLRCEIDLIDRCAGNPHEHPRRRGLERLLFELSSPPTPVCRPASNGQGGLPTHG